MNQPRAVNDEWPSAQEGKARVRADNLTIGNLICDHILETIGICEPNDDPVYVTPECFCNICNSFVDMWIPGIRYVFSESLDEAKQSGKIRLFGRTIIRAEETETPDPPAHAEADAGDERQAEGRA